MSAAKYEQHPIGKRFPEMSLDDWKQLSITMRSNGFLHQDPIYLYQGMILDGWHRYQVCLKYGIEPIFAEYIGDKPRLFAFAKNVSRRHLLPVQRISLAKMLLPELEEEEKLTLAERDKRVAEKAGVSERLVRAERHVVANGVPELKKAVKNGDVPVMAGEKISKLPKSEQVEALHENQTIVRKANKHAAEVEEDQVGNELPDKLIGVFKNRNVFVTISRNLSEAATAISRLFNSPGGERIPAQLILEHLATAKKNLSSAAPYAVCPLCRGEGCDIKDNPCRGLGWVTKSTYDNLPDDAKKKKK